MISLGLALAVSARAGADAVTPAPLAPRGPSITPNALAVVRVMNSVRASHGLPPLRVGRALTRAARSHSVDMARRGYFEHGAFVRRLRSFGVRAPYIGENLASGTQPLSAAAIVQMWIASPPHRQNLLDRSFRRVGVGEAGGLTRLVTADFAGR
ncbi:MAG TPA: CAP domain-containing protein [Gaiellaceae bacterium]|jgi:uncharacterized protein YkwD